MNPEPQGGVHVFYIYIYILFVSICRRIMILTMPNKSYKQLLISSIEIVLEEGPECYDTRARRSQDLYKGFGTTDVCCDTRDGINGQFWFPFLSIFEI